MLESSKIDGMLWGSVAEEEKIFLISQDVKKSSLHPSPETGEKQEIFLFFPSFPFILSFSDLIFDY